MRITSRLSVAVALLALWGGWVQAQDSASLHGTVRDAQGRPVAGASVHLQPADAAKAQTAQTDSQGAYSLAGFAGGVYALRAEMGGGHAEIQSLFFAPKESKTVDLTLVERSALAPNSKAEFFDQPQFSVAGVTDTTALGGHGSDAVVRTRESLAKDTVALGKESSAQPASSDEQILREAVKRDPKNFDANHRLGELLIRQGKAGDAIEYLDHARELRPGDSDNSYDLAVAHCRAGNYRQARDEAQELLAHSDKADLHHLLAEAQEKLGNSLEAVRQYQRAAELDPSEPYFFDWGSELLLHHAPEPALEVFNEGVQRFPRSQRMLLGAGASLFARGEYDRAVQKISDASDLDPGNPAPYLFLGRMQTAESAPSEKVVAALRRFATQQPDSADANYYYAVGLWKLDKAAPDATGTAEIERLLDRAIRLNPQYAAAYLQLGIVEVQQKKASKAIFDLERAVAIDPKLEAAHFRLAQIYRQQGETDRAEAELKIYHQLTQESEASAERERHEIRQFVYTLRDQATPQNP